MNFFRPAIIDRTDQKGPLGALLSNSLASCNHQHETMTEMMGHAQVSAPAITDSPSRDINLSGSVIYPSIGLMGEF